MCPVLPVVSKKLAMELPQKACYVDRGRAVV